MQHEKPKHSATAAGFPVGSVQMLFRVLKY
jgi:hypothetical protein